MPSSSAAVCHQVVDGGLGRGIRSERRRREICVDGRKQDHRAAARAHRRNTQLQQADGADDVHVVEIEERLRVGVEHAAREAGRGRVNHDVGSAELRSRSRDRLFERCAGAHVRRHAVVARGAGRDIEPGDACAFSLKPRNDRRADTARRAGHQRDPTAQFFLKWGHSSFPRGHTQCEVICREHAGIVLPVSIRTSC